MARYVLRIAGGSTDGRELELTGPVEIGRDPAAGLALPDDQLVSSRHATVSPHADGAVVEDLGSRNGTFVNNVRIAEPTLIRPGDVLQIGNTTIAVVVVQEAAPAGFLLQLNGPRGSLGEFPLTQPLEIGRNPSAGLALIEDHLVSWSHARLSPLADGVAVDDLGSRNGTFVNGTRISAPASAKAGDRIVVGDTTIDVREEQATLEYVLEVVADGGGRTQARLTKPLEIGRDPGADFPLPDDPLVSRLHARVSVTPDGIVVEDLGSRNGTWVNGVQIAAPTLVGPADEIRVGRAVLELRRAEAAGASGLTVAQTAFHTAVVRYNPQPASPPGQPEPHPDAPTGERPDRPVWTFVLTSLALFMAVLDNLVVLFALPSIQVSLNASVQQLEWTVNAFTLTFAVALLPAATLGDRFGRRRVFAIGVAIFTVASLACALAPNIETLLLARAVQGLGGAVITPLTLTILSVAFREERRGLAIGAWSGVAGLAVALGPMVGGAVVTAFSWEWIFWINVPVGIIVAPLVMMRLRESFGPSSRIDLPGVVLVATGCFGIVFGVIRASSVGWTSLQVLGPLLLGLVLLAAFVFWELRTAAPMLPMRLFRSRAFSAANVASFCMYFGMFGSIFLLAQFLQTAQGYSALEAGLLSLPWTGMTIFVAPIAGIVAERIGGRPLMVAGLALQAVALAWIALILDPEVPYSHMLGPFIVCGVGMSLFFAPVAIVILGAVGIEQEGVASGANNAIRELGGVFGIAVMTTIFASYGSYASPQAYTDGIIPPTWVGAVVLAIGAVASLVIPAMRPKEQEFPLEQAIPAIGGFAPSATRMHPIAGIRAAHATSVGRTGSG
jgi:EmrB/QacA subfamily drug resistance transporter